MLRRRLPLHQLAVATVLGVASGMYIFKSHFEGKRLEWELGRQQQQQQQQSNTDDGGTAEVIR